VSAAFLFALLFLIWYWFGRWQVTLPSSSQLRNVTTISIITIIIVIFA
jgi:hypothetical protein